MAKQICIQVDTLRIAKKALSLCKAFGVDYFDIGDATFAANAQDNKTAKHLRAALRKANINYFLVG